MLADFIEGSDPGLCVAESVPPAAIEWGQRCRREVVDAAEARAIARACGIHLEGLGGSEGGVIGALAAVGLAATGDHGRVIQDERWSDEVVGETTAEAIRSRGVDAIVEEAGGAEVRGGVVDAGRKLRPNRRGGRTVLFVERAGAARWVALRRD